MNVVTIMSHWIWQRIARLGPLAVFTVSLLAPEHASAASGTVYFIIGSDTAIWYDGTTVDVYTRHPHYPQSFFTTPGSPALRLVNTQLPVFRHTWQMRLVWLSTPASRMSSLPSLS